MITFGFRWPIYLILCITAFIGLVNEWRARRIQVKGERLPLHIVTFRSITVITFLYALYSLGRTIWVWCDPNNIYAVPLWADPPGNVILAMVINGIALGWVATYLLYQYFRRVGKYE
jgi:hypothetical protein